MKIKFSKDERLYWAQVLIAASQITFGLAWASMFLPVWFGGWLIIRRKK